jgi:hypothetical protein
MFFPCDKCGICCTCLADNPLYYDLDRGDGTCIYFNGVSRLCSIYETRPVKCNIRKFYSSYPLEISYQEYIEANIDYCKKLKELI